MIASVKLASALVVSIFGIAPLGCGDNIEDPDALRGPSIAGSVWADQDGDNLFEAGETALPGFTVFLDLNQNEIFDPGEPSTQSDERGAYRFVDLEPGSYEVRQEPQFGWRSVFESTGAWKPASDNSWIIGGNDAAAGEYPFMVSVGITFDFGEGLEVFPICGGALVSDRHVITAAHCSEGIDPTGAGVILGTNDLEGPNAQLILASAITIHPSYTGDTEEGFDIAVWQLAERLDLRDRGLRTVELVTEATEAMTLPGGLATTLGWGNADNDSELLQEVHVPLVSEGECQAAYPRVATLETQICAGVMEGGVDSCQGDSGGPLLVRNPNTSAWMHAGVTSWGDGCAEPGFPGVYARTSALSAWAMSEMLEPSRVFRVEVIADPVFADFGNQSTLLPLEDPIDPRWQLTTISIDGAANGAVAANTPLDFRLAVIDELGPGARSFQCALDSDGPGVGAPVSVTCPSGSSVVGFAGYADGAYRATLSVTDGALKQQRSALVIAGSPTSDIAVGALATTDQTDPDFNDTYYIDYYEITGAGPMVLAISTVATTEFNPFFVLYDGDSRDPTSGGGTIEIGGQLELFPESGKRYLIGVSSFSSEETGAYTVTLTNNGTLTAVTL